MGDLLQRTQWLCLVRDRRDLDAAEKLVMVALILRANDANTCWPSHKKLAVDTSLSPRKVGDAVRRVTAKGLVDAIRREDRGVNRYTINPGALAGDRHHVPIPSVSEQNVTPVPKSERSVTQRDAEALQKRDATARNSASAQGFHVETTVRTTVEQARVVPSAGDRHHVPKGEAPGAEGIGTTCRRDRHHVPTNQSIEPISGINPKNGSNARARDRGLTLRELSQEEWRARRAAQRDAAAALAAQWEAESEPALGVEREPNQKAGAQ